MLPTIAHLTSHTHTRTHTHTSNATLLHRPISVSPASFPLPPLPSRLPPEVARRVFLNLSLADIARAAAVCRRWKALTEDTQLWRALCRRRWDTKVRPRARPIMSAALVCIQCTPWPHHRS